jgi:hypothetical protein
MQQRIVYAFIGLIVIGLFGLAIYTFFSSQISNRPAAVKPLTLVDYFSRDTAQVRYTVSGPTVADEYHNAITISVGKVRRSVEAFRTYAETPAFTQEFDNNQPAFEDFMRAIQNAGFTAAKTRAGNPTEVGLCPTGQRYVFELIDNGKTVLRTWATSCGDAGTFNGSPATIRSLFQAQIPGYAKLVNGISLNGAP